MSKFNQTNTNLTKNISGHDAYKMSDKHKLVNYVLTSFYGEEKYYGDTTNDMVQLAEKVSVKEPQFVANLARYARKEFHLRSVSHALTCIVAHNETSKKYTKKVVTDVVERADDLTEILACYISMYGKPIPNALKKALASNLKRFNEYQISKYNGGNKAVKFKDILLLTHPKPSNENESKLFKKILEDKLEIAKRWETEVSTKGNKEEVWEDLIENNQLGYMALVRNLVNIIKAAPKNADKALSKLTNKEEVLKSKLLPFRFYSAYKEVEKTGGFVNKYLEALETALDLSVENLPKIKGKTIIAIDASGSMDNRISTKSDIKCYDIAKLLGVIVSHICEESIVMTFKDVWYGSGTNRVSLKKITKRGGIIDQAENKFEYCDGGTPMEAPFLYICKNNIYADRIIVLSDNECNSNSKVVQKYADSYRKIINPNLWVHAIDLQGYGTQQFMGKNTNIIAGWSEKVLNFITLVEQGEDTLIKAIENYD